MNDVETIPELARRLAAQYLARAADAMAEHAATCKAAAYRAKNRGATGTFQEQQCREGAFTCAELHLREDAAELTGIKPPPKRRLPVVESAGLFEVAS
ncbi:hypothetical protein ACFWIW_10955 [Amycolatopsis sp. NPDC058340]|uniref:hypothetical protein n=1 Tax=Amycolatopsis sp. NPDC058340 TaxID=3346453 RepID=UPI00364B3053